MPRGGQIGNTNASNGAMWRNAIKRALARAKNPAGRRAIYAIADKLIEQAMAGDAWAIKELGDRLDGKAAQSLTLDHDGTLRIVLEDAIARRQSNG